MASCWGSNSINLRKRSAARIRAPNMCVNTGFSPKPREQFSSLRSSTNNPSSVGPSLARRMGDRQTAPTSAESTAHQFSTRDPWAISLSPVSAEDAPARRSGNAPVWRRGSGSMMMTAYSTAAYNEAGDCGFYTCLSPGFPPPGAVQTRVDAPAYCKTH